MFKVTQRVFVNNLVFQPNVLYQGQPNGISPRYCEVISNDDTETANDDKPATKRGRKRKRAVARNVAITNSDKE